jgi:hypothetical protein
MKNQKNLKNWNRNIQKPKQEFKIQEIFPENKCKYQIKSGKSQVKILRINLK